MALHFHQLTVKNVKRETSDSISVDFDVPVSLKTEFKFKQGQNITLRKIINGEDIRRSYSICSAPQDNKLTIGIKKAFNGLFSTYANEHLKAGDLLDVMPPSGTFFTDLDPENQKNYVAYAAGSGITPILSILKTTLQTEPNSTFTLFYGNRNHLSIMFKEELEALKNKYINRLSLHHILSGERTDADINYGRIDTDKCWALTRLKPLNNVDEFFICGPEAMVFCVRDFLHSNEVDTSKIHFELFNSPVRRRTVLRKENKSDAINNSRVTVKLDGRSFDFNLDYNSNTILDAALAEGADLPFACKGGVCTTCKAKLVEGNIEMEVNYGLEPDEVRDGFILTCQSHPRSNKVVVDYDVK